MATKRANVLYCGPPGAGKTTTASNMILSALSRQAGLPNSGLSQHWQPNPASVPQGAAGGFRLRSVSATLTAGTSAISANQFPAKTLPEAAGRNAEMAVLDWEEVTYHLLCTPGEWLWRQGGIDMDALVAELRGYDALIFTFRAPTLSVPLGMKFLQGLTAAFQRKQLGYGFTAAVEAAVCLSFGITPEGFRKVLPLDHAAVARHEGSALRWNPTAGGGQFELSAMANGHPTATGPLMQALTNVVAYAVRSNVGNMHLRHPLPYVNHLAITALTHVDLANQFVPAITQDDWAQAFDLIWGGADGRRLQQVLVPNVRMALQPVNSPAFVAVESPDLTGAERLWTSIHQVVHRPKAAAPAEEFRPAPARRSRGGLLGLFARGKSGPGSRNGAPN